jgi:cysteine-S-conjugate beta-lyase
MRWLLFDGQEHMRQDKTNRQAGINTRLAHSGNDPHAYFGFVNPPVVHASTVLFPEAGLMAGRHDGRLKYSYGTHGTPTTDALGSAVDELEGSAGTVAVPSGLAAVALPFLAFLSAGDHALVTDSVYSPTRTFCDGMLKRLGVEVEYYDPLIGGGIASLMRANTKLVFTESPASQTFEVQDIGAIAAAAHGRGAVVVMDNTWATPVYFRALDHGVDVTVHAATKYPGGHSDLVLGLVSANEKCWTQIKQTFLMLGICAGPDDVYQVLRGLRTMGIRLERHQKSALEVARWMEGKPGVARVLHPALESHPGHALWKRDFSGASGLFSFVLAGGGEKAQHAFLDALEIFGLGYSWGGYESLAVPVFLRDRTIAKGPHEGPLIRLQIGLEDVDDLKADIERGLAAALAVL